MDFVLVAVALSAAPVLLGLSIAAKSDIPIAIFALLQAALLVLVFVRQTINWTESVIGAEEIAYLFYFALMALSSLLALARFSQLTFKDLFSPLTLAVLWTSPILVTPYLLTTCRSLEFAKKTFDAIGLLVAATVLAAGLGLELGEVQLSEATGLRRVFGLYGDSASIVCAFFFVKSLAERRYVRSAAFGASVLLTVGLGAILVAGAGVIATWFAKRRMKGVSGDTGSLSVPARIVVTVMAFGAFALLGGSLLARFTLDGSLAFSLAIRLGSYMTALRVLSEEYLLGVGYSGFRIVSGSYAPEEFFSSFSENYTSTAQNQLVQSSLDAGVLGALALVVLIYLCLRRAYRAAQRHADASHWFIGSFGALCGVALGYQSGIWIVPNSLVPFVFFSAVGLSIAACRLQKSQ